MAGTGINRFPKKKLKGVPWDPGEENSLGAEEAEVMRSILERHPGSICARRRLEALVANGVGLVRKKSR